MVEDVAKWLTLMHAISLAINESTTWDDALQRVLHRLCESEHWQIGHIYLPDPADADTITATVGWMDQPRFQPFHAATLAQRYRKGQSLPARVYAEGRPVWVNAQQELLELVPFRRALAEQLDLACAAAMPVRFGPDVVAVLELFSDRPHPPTEQYSELMEDVGHQIGRVVERERSTARMAELVWREQQGLLHTLHDSLGQTLTGLGMLSTGLAQRLQGADAGAVASAQEISRQAQDALEQVRQLAKNLFPIEVEAQSLMLAISPRPPSRCTMFACASKAPFPTRCGTARWRPSCIALPRRPSPTP
jgi:signal transduction histidine kinase